MKLNLSPEQFLIVYNGVTNNSSLTAQEVKTKMDSQLIEALSLIDDSSNQSKFTSWMKQEKTKVSSLNEELKTLKLNQDQQPDDGLYFRPTNNSDERNKT